MQGLIRGLGTLFLGPRAERAAPNGLRAPVVGELEFYGEILPLEELDDGLEIVPVLARHTNLVRLDGCLDPDLRILDGLHHLFGLVLGDPLLEGHPLADRTA